MDGMNQEQSVGNSNQQVIAEQAEALLDKMNDEASEGADFLSFKLANELYGVQIKDVEEIRVWERPTPIPRSPDFVCGVINLRGMIVPVVDLRARFLVGQCEYLATTVVIVLRSVEDDQEHLMGLVVDAVSDVVAQGNNEIYQSVGESLVTPYIHGLINVGDQVMSLLDTDELLNIERILRAN
ncbi:purine-binding chemotaxis protein CheW [Vibrio aquaticus]|uniref:Chemotaxis protein CheW n=2 Tax=Vibrio aquaticus TaxID=2496559 RepID=A0A3S0PRC6_9VIBR|nr:chemotaxis protein CheW [Vibrio aquaticus]RTZ17916.1 purine-binding chemotaxis protein CheW [Vibrio aquaticus]